MERHLSHYGYDPTYRIRAVTAKDVTVPQEVSVAKDCSWTHNHTVNYVTSSAIFNSGRGGVKRVVTAPSTTTALTSSTSNVNRSVFKDMYKILITALCGRPRNSRRELVVTISHLMAIRAAIYSNTPSQYALILEDDVKIPFDIDFVQVLSAYQLCIAGKGQGYVY
jgi:alpha-tubulin suppressor-like RCC1 family protein